MQSAGPECISVEEREAIARLMVSAPEMLEALKECYFFAELFNHDTDQSWAPTKARVLAVIAKAEGR